ncbi:ABC transporter ATP-binding protein [Gemmiger formicilis]|uniref:ABC transporter ATP-binding protein n=1 Tax=Gemmiger formicilis TaxID=745368 RepID=UPI00195AF54D|nr:ABC transporter ATP-binding protein [Gemmiger formicilis]MBM6914505.1 ABC transporter ATP-binding protein [Gemmiger formicilis]
MERAKGNVTGNVVLECRNVGRTFKGYNGAPDNEVLRGVDFTVRENEFLVLFGAGQCGKTTLLNILAGLDLPTEGEVYDRGTKVTGPAPARGVVYQKTSLFPWMTVEDNVGFGPKVRHMSKTERAERIKKYLELVGLTGFEKSYPSQLSGGMRQRVGIARAYANQPDIMLMDEPFGHLDAQTRYMMEEELQRIWQKEKRTVVFVTNNIEEALFLADRIILLTNCPTHIKKEYVINMPHPRDYTDPEFLRLRQEITENMDLTL